MYIIDFDDTLFDTHAFKEARLKALKKIGVSPALFWTTYKNARTNSNGVFTYSDKRHAEILVSEGFDEDEVWKSLNKVTSKIKDFLIEDTEEFLQALKKLGQPMILLSLGDAEYQELKVKGCGIEKYFDRVFFVNETKEQTLKELFNVVHDENIWLINDKVDESQQLKISFPDLQIVLKISQAFPVDIYRKSGFTSFVYLNEILEYVRK